MDCFISVIGPNQTILSRINEDTDVKDVQREMEEAAETDTVAKKKQVEIFNIKVIFDKKSDKGVLFNIGIQSNIFRNTKHRTL